MISWRSLGYAIVLICGFLQVASADSQDPTHGSGERSAREFKASPGATDPIATTRPDFSGTWVLDRSASDDPRKILQAGPKSAPRPRPGGGADGGFKRGPAGAGGGLRRAPSDKGKHGDGLPGDLSAETLTIVHQDPLLTITTDRFGERRFYTDFRGASVSVKGGRDQDVIIGGWEDDILVIETTTPGGGHTVQRLQLLDRPVRLERTTEQPARETERERRQIRQIFRPEGQAAEDGSSPDAAADNDFTWMED